MHVVYEYKVLLERIKCVCHSSTNQSSSGKQYSELNIRRYPSSCTECYCRSHEDFLQSLEGVVLGPQELPVVGARVELPALRLSTRTDSKGGFRFSAVPAQPASKLLRVTAKGRELSVQTEADAGRQPMVIHFDPTRGS